jgi:hypothetical protein
MARTERFVTYPRAAVQLSITLEGGATGREEIRTGIIPSRAAVTKRPHNAAGDAEITILGSAMPFDPRQVAGIVMKLFLGEPGRVDGNVETRENLRFVGFVDEMHTVRDDKGPSVELKARDLSSILRDFKPIPADVVPRYSQTIGEAIEAIVGATPGAADPDGALRLRLRAVAGVTDRRLSVAAPARAARAPIHLPRETTAWQAIEHVCGLVSLLVSVQLDEIIVREANDVYGNSKTPSVKFTFGGADANLLSVESTKKFVRNRKGVKVTSFDPVRRVRLEAVYPADADVASDRRPHAHVGGSAIRTPTRRHAARGAEIDRDVFPANGITTQDALDRYAERLYRERSRQEIEGKIVSPVWTGETLSIENADRLEIEIDPDLAAEIRSAVDLRSAATLVERRLGVTAAAARILVRSAIYHPTDRWYARSITSEFDAEARSTVSVEFLNLIQVNA